MQTIRLELLERSYNVHVGAGLLDDADGLLDAAGMGGRPLFIVTDENIQASCPAAVEAFVRLPGRRSRVAAVPAGEDSKSIESFASLMDSLVRFDSGEGAAVVALGGGVVGDLSGFVAACYKRGVPWVQAPTTLLAQVDASVGGKTAINHPTAKNLIGAFHQPRLVMADVSLLSTLPARELRSGLAEVIKHGVIADPAFFERIENTIERALSLDPAVLEDYVASSCIIKGAAVTADERDTTGRRAALNYGHTLGHAIELAAHYRYAHGEAIAIGMACAGDIAVARGALRRSDADRIEALLRRAGLPTRAAGVDRDDILAAMRLDKKFQGGSNRFVICTGIGSVELQSDIPESLIGQVLDGRLD